MKAFTTLKDNNPAYKRFELYDCRFAKPCVFILKFRLGFYGYILTIGRMRKEVFNDMKSPEREYQTNWILGVGWHLSGLRTCQIWLSRI